MGNSPTNLDADGFLALWQVQATIIGLALALTVFVLESGGLTARLRRDLTSSSRVYQAATIGVLLVVVTGEAVVHRTIRSRKVATAPSLASFALLGMLGSARDT